MSSGGLKAPGKMTLARKPVGPGPGKRPQTRPQTGSQTRSQARGRAGRPVSAPPKGTGTGPLARVKRGASSTGLELKNPFAGINGKRPAATPGAVASSGSVPSFLSGGAPTPAASGREARERHQRAGAVKALGLAAAAVCVFGVVVLIAFFVLRDSMMFSVESIVVEASAHVSEADASKLLTVSDTTTLLNVDVADIEAQLKRDPWVQSVELTREFPHTLKLTIREQSADLLVVMASGSLGWYLGSGGSWIEPVKITVADGQSVNDAALKKARSEGVTLVTGVPATVDPVAGSAATDDVLAAVQAFRAGFSEEFSSKVVSYDASSADAVSCVLESGVRVLLGSATNIAYKEEVASALLAKYPGQVTYINVRIPSTPSVRRVSSDDVAQGTGADGGDGSDGETGGSSGSDGSGGSSGSDGSGGETGDSSGEGAASGASDESGGASGSGGDSASASTSADEAPAVSSAVAAPNQDDA